MHRRKAMALALTDRDYWDRVWAFTDDDQTPRIHVDVDQHQAFLDRTFAARLAPGRRFLEVGAGGSAWPAHVAARYGAEGWGIDFSRPGLEMAARAARRGGVCVSLVEGDFFDPTKLEAGSFDVVYSGGFVEHFPDAAPLMARLAGLLAPGGVVVTTVPNLQGLNGWLQRLADPECFARHIVFTPSTLDAQHALGGLVPVLAARHLGVLDMGAVNFLRLAAHLPSVVLRLLWLFLSGSRRIAEGAAAVARVRDGGLWLAPSLIGIYRRE
jgi:2-polyprenyl-3-methyl-5-hydroxy-6-metoxy-1,4-benzoquinol methylase